jgi:hypothetical protein
MHNSLESIKCNSVQMDKKEYKNLAIVEIEMKEIRRKKRV